MSEFKISQPLGKSDHVSMIIDLNLFQPKASHNFDVDDKVRNWAKIGPEELLDMSLNLDWGFSKNVNELSVDEVWEEIHGKLSEITSCVPQLGHFKPGKIDNSNMPWINSSLKRAVRAKNKAWGNFDDCPDINNLNIALSKQNIFEKLDLKSKLKYEKVITHDLKHN